jgi:hypothetical protein
LVIFGHVALRLYHLQKKKNDKEKVKFRMLYQALTKVCPRPGKETAKFGSGMFHSQCAKAAKRKDSLPSVFFASFARPQKIVSTHTIPYKTRNLVASAGSGLIRIPLEPVNTNA